MIIYSRLDTAEEMFSECKDTAVKTIQNEAQKNANHKNNEMNKSKNKKKCTEHQ